MSYSNIKKSLAIALLSTAFTSFSYAGVFNVTNTNDNGAGSLRQAIIDANMDADENSTIKFTNAVNNPISLLSNLPAIGRPNFEELTIDFSGASAKPVKIDGGDNGYFPFNFIIPNQAPTHVNLDTGANEVVLNQSFTGRDTTLIKMGTGTLGLFYSDNIPDVPFDGTVLVRQGTFTLNQNLNFNSSVIVEANGTLLGDGCVQKNLSNNGGIVSVGYPGTKGELIVTGDFTQNNGVLRVNVTPDGASLLDVMGAVDLTGKPTLVIAPSDGTYTDNSSFTIVKAGDDIKGKFSEVKLDTSSSIANNYSFTVQQYIDGIKLLIKSLTSTKQQQDSAQTGTNAAHDNTKIQYQVIASTIKDQVSDTTQSKNCLSLIASDPQAHFEIKTLEQLHKQSNYISALQQLGEYIPSSKSHITDQLSKKVITSSPFSMLQEVGKVLWVRTIGVLGFNKNDGSVAGYKSRGGGLIAGLNTTLFNDVPFGIFAGYSGTRIDLRNDNGHSDVGRFFAGPHLTIPFNEQLALNTILSLGFGRTDNNRNILNTPTKMTAKSKQKNTDFFGSLTLMYTTIQNDWIFNPYIGIEALESRRKAYTERNAGRFNLSFSRQSTTNISGITGFNLTKVYSFEEGRWSAQLTAGYRYDRASKGKTTFTIIGNPLSLSASLPHKTRHSFNIGPSVAVVYKTGLTVHGGYRTTLSKKSHAHEFVVGVKKKI